MVIGILFEIIGTIFDLILTGMIAIAAAIFG